MVSQPSQARGALWAAALLQAGCHSLGDSLGRHLWHLGHGLCSVQPQGSDTRMSLTVLWVQRNSR